MAKIYSTFITGIGRAPCWLQRLTTKENREREQEWLDKLRAYCKTHGNGDLAGEVVREPVADGFASYMVYTTLPLALIHIPLGDGYHSPWAPRWRVADVRRMVENERVMAALCGPPPASSRA